MKKTFSSYLFICTLLAGCGNKTTNDQSMSTLQSQNNLSLIGGSITKEIIIKTNNQNSKDQIVIASNIASFTRTQKEELQDEEQKKVIVYTLEKARTYKPEVYNNVPPLIEKDTLIDMGVAGTTTLMTAATGPVGGVAINVLGVLGGSALKDFTKENDNTPITSAIEKLSDRNDTQILELAVQMADQLGSQVFRDMHLGIDPKFIKENILNFKSEIYQNTDLTYEDLQSFQKAANDSLLFNYMMAINSHEIQLQKDVKTLSKDIKENTKQLKEISKNTQNFVDIQKNFFDELDKRFSSPREKELFMAAIFDKGTSASGKELLKPEQLAFLKDHPEKAKEYRQLLERYDVETLTRLIQIQEKAQKSLAYLQVTSQIANNLNLGPNILNAISTGTNIANTITSLTAFAITPNPLSALQALSSITGLFSKPKPDPRFTAIFENFKAINRSLQDIQSQLKGIAIRLDNVDDGLSYIISQGEIIKDQLNSLNTKDSKQCLILTSVFERNRKDLSFDFFTNNFKLSHQGDSSKIDACLNYLLTTFEGTPVKNNIFLADMQSTENLNDDPEITKYFSTADQIKTVYNALYPSSASVLKGNEYLPKNLLSIKQVLMQTEILLNNSFLFDIARVNAKNSKWEIVEKDELKDTIAKNKKSQQLIENAITLIEKTLIDQSVIDGTLQSKSTLDEFIYGKTQKCSDIKFKSVACAAIINPILMSNLITKSFKDLIGYDHYWAWGQISETNPDFLNEKLANTNLSVVWVGSGASSLYTGLVYANRPDLRSGAYIAIKGTGQLLPLPLVDSVKSDSHLVISERTNTLKSYKILLENELIERNIQKILNVEQLNFYNNQKIKDILSSKESV